MLASRRIVRAAVVAVLAAGGLAVGVAAPPAAAVVTAPGTNITPLVPARLLDTRPGEKTTDGQSLGAGKVGAAGTVTVKVTGRGGVPADHVGAVVLNVTIADPVAAGYATVFPAGAVRPNASNLNYEPGQTVPNLAIAKVGVDGQVSIFVQSSAHVVADVMGFVRDEPGFTSVVPARLLDTRADGRTDDGRSQAGGAVGAQGTLVLPVLGRGGVPAVGVGAVLLNVTVTEPVGPGFVTVFPTGAERPHASNLNMTNGQTVPNLVLAKVGTGGTVSIFTTARTHLVADVVAWVVDVPGVHSVVPARLLDTRPGEPTTDGVSAGAGPVTGGTSVDVVVTGRGNVPILGVAAVVLNVTVVDPAAAGFATVWPAGAGLPLASNLNYVTGETVPNLVVAKVGAGGKVSLFTQQSAHLVADVVGYVVEPEVQDWTFEPADWVNTAMVPGHAATAGVHSVSGDGRYAVVPVIQPVGVNFSVHLLRADRALQTTRDTFTFTLTGSTLPAQVLVGNDGRVAAQLTAGGSWTLWEPTGGSTSSVATCQLPSMGYFVAVAVDASDASTTYCRLADGVMFANVETASANGRFLVTNDVAGVRLVDAVTGYGTAASEAYAGFDNTTPFVSDWGDLTSWDLGPPDLVTVRQLDGTTATFAPPNNSDGESFLPVDVAPNGGAVVITRKSDGALRVEDLANGGTLLTPPGFTCALAVGGFVFWASLGSCVPT